MGRHSRRGRSDERADKAGNAERADRADSVGRASVEDAHGVLRFPDGTPAHGVPRFPDGTPAHGTPRFPDGTPANGFPQVRGGHPEAREPGGGWGQLRSGAPQGVAAGVPQGGESGYPGGESGYYGPRIPPQRHMPGPSVRQAYLDAFGGEPGADDDLFGSRTGAPHRGDLYGSVTDWDMDAEAKPLPGFGVPGKDKAGKGRTFTGIAAAAVTTVLAVVVAGQVASGREGAGSEGSGVRAQSTSGGDRGVLDVSAAPAPAVTQSVAPLTYDQKMAKKYALGATLDGSGEFDAVLGLAKAPGKGQKFTYRVDVEQGLGLDASLFAQAVQKTLNDDRSWAHNGGRTFERISSGKPDFVITLASPGTTAEWCAMSGLDTTEDNVSCDSASTERVMINAYRWAQGSETYGDQMQAYRQMLINHEIGHRLGYSHVTCDKDGELAPVMQQQTKFLDHDGIHCKANPWPYPGS
ncbi:DUF3152 domain-containing protein [Streptomyces sp. NPDC060223]|uniref:DUF3152 domain-containing protein n=1 Tax=unclassified Streptomyces TaxID=2593676 RepID=UPI0036434F21